MNYALPLQAFTAQVTNNPDQIYLNQPLHGRWTSYSWAQVDDHARRIASALQAQGFKAGDRIAILSKNCAEWIVADLAIMMAGMVSVLIYATAGIETIQHVVTHSGAKAVFVGKLDSFDAAKAVLDGSVLRVGFPYPAVINRILAHLDEKELQEGLSLLPECRAPPQTGSFEENHHPCYRLQ